MTATLLSLGGWFTALGCLLLLIGSRASTPRWRGAASEAWVLLVPGMAALVVAGVMAIAEMR